MPTTNPAGGASRRPDFPGAGPQVDEKYRGTASTRGDSYSVGTMSALTSSMPNISKVLAEWPGAVVILGGFAFQHHYPKEVAAHPWLGTDDIDVKLWITTPACNLASARQIFFRLTELLGTGTTDRKVYLNQPPEEMAFLGNSPLVDVVLYHRNRLGPTLSLFCFPKPAHGQPCGVTPTQNGPYRYVASLELTNFNTLHMLCVLYHAFLSNNSRSNRIPNAAKVLCRALASFAVNGNAKLLLSMFEDIGRLPLSDSLTKFKHRDSQLDAGAVLGSMVDKWVRFLTPIARETLVSIHASMKDRAQRGGGSQSEMSTVGRSLGTKQMPSDVDRLTEDIVMGIFEALLRPPSGSAARSRTASRIGPSLIASTRSGASRARSSVMMSSHRGS